MTTYIYGAYGTGNLGDDLLLKAALIENINKDVKIISYGKPYIKNIGEYIDHDDFISNPFKFLSSDDELIFGGGGLFWASTHCDDMLKVAKAAKQVGGSVHVSRIGAQGFHCNTEAVRSLMDISDTVTVRDQQSVELLLNHGVTDKASYLPDYALTLGDYIKKFKDKSTSGSHNSGKLSIGINHSATPFYHDIEHRRKALHIYSHIANKFANEVEFYYIPHTRHFRCIDQNDIINGEHFYVASNGLIKPFAFPNDIDELLELYSKMDGVIGWRYHLLATGKLFNLHLAFLGQPGQHKYGAFASENKIPQIDFNLTTSEIISSFSRWIERIKISK